MKCHVRWTFNIGSYQWDKGLKCPSKSVLCWLLPFQFFISVWSLICLRRYSVLFIFSNSETYFLLEKQWFCVDMGHLIPGPQGEVFDVKQISGWLAISNSCFQTNSPSWVHSRTFSALSQVYCFLLNPCCLVHFYEKLPTFSVKAMDLVTMSFAV